MVAGDVSHPEVQGIVGEYLVKQFKNTLENNGTWFGLIDDYNRHKQNLLADYDKTLNLSLIHISVPLLTVRQRHPAY